MRSVQNFTLFLRAGKNDSLSQADVYFKGDGVEKNLTTAEALYQESVRKKLPGADFKLGLFYHSVGQFKKAAKFYFAAYQAKNLLGLTGLQELNDAGCLKARFYLGLVSEQKKEWLEAEAYYLQAVGATSLALYRLGRLYRENRNSPALAMPVIIASSFVENALYYQAITQRCALALQKLKENAETDKIAAFYMAKVLDYPMAEPTEEGVQYYLKAANLGIPSAHFRLGRMYEEGVLMVPDIEKAFSHYLKALVALHSFDFSAVVSAPSTIIPLLVGVDGLRFDESALLDRLMTLIEVSESDQLARDLGEYCIYTRGDEALAAQSYKFVADRSFEKAEIYIKALKDSASNVFCHLGMLYEAEPGVISDLKMVQAYGAAMLDHNELALRRLEEMARSGNVEAAYVMGMQYCKLSDYANGFNWLVLAAKALHEDAKAYLLAVDSGSIAFMIARAYDEGKECERDATEAMAFYHKALNGGEKSAAMMLARLYDLDMADTETNRSLACKYYMMALSQGDFSALDALDRLMEVVSFAVVREFITVLRSPAVNAISHAEYWEEKIGDRPHAMMSISSAALAAASSTLFLNAEQLRDGNFQVKDV